MSKQKAVRISFFGSLSLLALHAFTAWGAAQPDVQIKVQLSPAGSFEAKSQKVQGHAVKEGEAYKAENVVIPLSDLQTGIELRDDHMKNKYLEVAKYPDAKLKGAKGEKGNFSGELEIRGVTKPISGTYAVEGDLLKASFSVKMSEYNIAKANYMGIGAKDEVKIQTSVPIQVAKRATSATKKN